jgi:hypothetical protein
MQNMTETLKKNSVIILEGILDPSIAQRDSWLAQTLIALKGKQGVLNLNFVHSFDIIANYITVCTLLFENREISYLIKAYTAFGYLLNGLLSNPRALFDYYVKNATCKELDTLCTPFQVVMNNVTDNLPSCLVMLTNTESAFLLHYYNKTYNQKIVDLTTALRKRITIVTERRYVFTELQELDMINMQLMRALADLYCVFTNFKTTAQLLQRREEDIILYIGDAHAIECISILTRLDAKVEGHSFNYQEQHVFIK